MWFIKQGYSTIRMKMKKILWLIWYTWLRLSGLPKTWPWFLCNSERATGLLGNARPRGLKRWWNNSTEFDWQDPPTVCRRDSLLERVRHARICSKQTETNWRNRKPSKHHHDMMTLQTQCHNSCKKCTLTLERLHRPSQHQKDFTTQHIPTTRLKNDAISTRMSHNRHTSTVKKNPDHIKNLTKFFNGGNVLNSNSKHADLIADQSSSF